MWCNLEIPLECEKCGSSGGAHRKSVTLHQSGSTICKSSRKDLFKRGLGSLRKDPSWSWYWQISRPLSLARHSLIRTYFGLCCKGFGAHTGSVQILAPIFRHLIQYYDAMCPNRTPRIWYCQWYDHWCIFKLVINCSQLLEVTFLARYSYCFKLSVDTVTVFFLDGTLSGLFCFPLCQKSITWLAGLENKFMFRKCKQLEPSYSMTGKSIRFTLPVLRILS